MYLSTSYVDFFMYAFLLLRLLDYINGHLLSTYAWENWGIR